MHHITARSIAEEKIFRDSGDYTTGIRILAELVADGFVVCHQFCFMPTHYHVIGTFDDLSNAIHKLNRRYAVAYNRRYKRRGHVFDSPARKIEIETEEHHSYAACYVAANPPNPESWPYSSYPGMIGTRPPFSFVDATPIIDAFESIDAFRRPVAELRQVEDANLVPSETRLKGTWLPRSGTRFMSETPRP
jgi:hypothetical protein